MLLGFCKLLQVAVSIPVLHSMHTCRITNAKGGHWSSTNFFCFRAVGFHPQLFAQNGGGCNLHNLQILCTLFPQQLLICDELPNGLDNRIIEKTRDTLQLQLCTSSSPSQGFDETPTERGINGRYRSTECPRHRHAHCTSVHKCTRGAPLSYVQVGTLASMWYVQWCFAVHA